MNKIKKLTIGGLTCFLSLLVISTVASAMDNPDYTWQSSGESWAFFGLSLVACAIFVLVWFIIWILVAIWVYKDAEKRGSSGALWLIIVIIAGIIGIIIWLVVRPPIGGEKKPAASDRRCPNCGRVIPMDARVCPYCGKKFDYKIEK